jgi:uncharacterized integral membrane protein
MYISLVITFVLLLVIVITSLQNSMPLDLKFITWNIQMSFTALVLYSSVIGGSVVAILILPKLVKKSLHVRSLNREIHKLKENMTALGKEHVEGPNRE